MGKSVIIAEIFGLTQVQLHQVGLVHAKSTISQTDSSYFEFMENN